MVYLSYNLHGHYGLIHGMGKLVPFFRGAGPDLKAVEIENTTFTAITILATINSLSILILSLMFEGIFKDGLQIFCFIVFINQFYTFFLTISRNDKNFFLLSALIFFVPVFAFISILILDFISLLSIETGLLAFLVSYSLCNLMYIYTKGFRFQFVYQIEDLKKIFVVGLPLLILNVLSSLLLTIDRLLISSLGYLEILSFFGIAMMLVGGFYSIPGAIASVLFPYMLEMFGKSKDSASLFNETKPLIYLSSVISCLLAINLCIFLPLILETFLPEYKKGLGTITTIVLFSSFYLNTSIVGNYLISADKQWQQNMALVIGILVISSSILVINFLNLDAELFKFAVAGGLVTYSLISLLQSFFYQKNFYGLAFSLLLPIFSILYFLTFSWYFKSSLLHLNSIFIGVIPFSFLLLVALILIFKSNYAAR